MTDTTPAPDSYRAHVAAAIHDELETHSCVYHEAIDEAAIVDAVLALQGDAATERDQLRAALLDIDAHATPYGDIPDDPGWVGTYLVTAGALHRALGKIGHTAPSCAAEAALALLHEGEEPYVHEHTVATPAQWIWQWNRATPAERLDMAGRIQDMGDRSSRCFMSRHDARLERLRPAEAALDRVRGVLDDWIQHRAMRPETRHALSEVRAALTGEEQPATGGIITRGLMVVGEGPVCDGPLMPGRSQWRGEHGPELVDLPRREPGAALAADEPEPTLGFIVTDHTRWPDLCDNSVRFEQVRTWLLANGIDPRDVPAKSTVAIEPRPDGSEIIRYTAYLRSENGQYLVPPGHASPAMAQRLAPLLVPLPCRTTDGDR